MLKEVMKCIINKYKVDSYSQEGEDSVLSRLMNDKNRGFYVDVGAHHPMRFSNTFHFYRKGWRGINIDAMPGSMFLFKKFRPRDINLEVAVGTNVGDMTYYKFDEPALNGFSKQLSTNRAKSTSYSIVDEVSLKMVPLSLILEEYLPKDQEIDFFSIDVEGYDLNVLNSNNWDKFRPNYVLVEVLNNIFEDMANCDVSNFLGNVGYKLVAKTVNTAFFVRVDK